jgi:hypothetical protein
MKIGLFSPAGDKQAERLQSALNALSPGNAQSFDLALAAPARSSMSATELTWNGVELTALDLAFLRGFAYCDPVVPAGDLDVDWSLWRFDYIGQQQKYTYLYSFFCELERRGVKLLNPPDAHLRLFMRPFVLEQLRQAGVNVPALTCTNRMDVAREFYGRHASVVWRPATGRAAYQLFQDRQREALVSLQKPPVLLAEVVAGPLIRAYLYDGQPLLCLKMGAPDPVGEETLERFVETDCGDVCGDLRRVADSVRVPWLQASFVLKDGRAWIYDLDADPMFEGLPTVHSEKLVTLLAARMLNSTAACPSAIPADAADAKERPTLFLRRMLDILFEFEESKYRK